MKLNQMQKQERKNNMEFLHNCGGIVRNNGQVTIVIAPTILKESPKFFYISIAYCNAEDTFKRKVGEHIALNRWNDGMSIIWPNFYPSFSCHEAMSLTADDILVQVNA